MTAEPNNRIGILGGTFNPIHTGHLILAQSALETFDLDRIFFIPSAKPPHKKPSVLADAEHRMAMLDTAIEDDMRFEMSDIEIKRGGPSYSIDTVRELKKIYPSVEFHFIIGADSLLELHLWKDINDLLNLCTFVTFGRPGVNIAQIQKKDLFLDPPWPEKLLENIVTNRLIDISSSDIRHRIAECMSIRYLVPRAVEMYIAEHNLYVR
ncbi:MAG: nicotinate-nucleotide adenylyltransferase [Kiritimatiellae bacterium]|nr:nicotinate-nucleotide adenylyltransferase [Kiritimatiellia bacterium]MDD5519624.1 nicotinate-nucleotide adenylyltransferase [Kiritimatiellia bacterium]